MASDQLLLARFKVLMAMVMLSVRGIARALTAQDAERRSFARLFNGDRALHGARRIEELRDRLLEELRPLLRFDDFYLELVDREQRALDFHVHKQHEVSQPVGRLPLDTGLFGWVVEPGKPPLIADWPRAPKALRQLEPHLQKALHVSRHSHRCGVLWCKDP